MKEPSKAVQFERNRDFAKEKADLKARILLLLTTATEQQIVDALELPLMEVTDLAADCLLVLEDVLKIDGVFLYELIYAADYQELYRRLTH